MTNDAPIKPEKTNWWLGSVAAILVFGAGLVYNTVDTRLRYLESQGSPGLRERVSSDGASALPAMKKTEKARTI